MSRSFFNSGLLPQVQPAAAPPVTRFGWDTDLTEVPEIVFEPALSTGCTEVQARAMLSASGGGLLVDPELAFAAGADADFVAIFWITPGIQAPLEFEYAAQQLTLALAGSIVAAGWYHFADQAALEAVTPTTPTGATPGTAPNVFVGSGGHNVSNPSSAYGWRGGYTSTPARTGGFTANYYVRGMGVETYNPYGSLVGIGTNFSAYPTTLVTTTTKTGSLNNPLSPDHRLRGFIGVLRNGAGTANNGDVRIDTATWIAQAIT